MKELSVVIVAGGKGLRMESTLPKQYLMLQVKPILVWTIEHLYKALVPSLDVEFVLVRPKGDDAYVREMMAQYLEVEVPLCYADGGDERAMSVYNGLLATTGAFVMVHDGVRPFVTSHLFERIWSKKGEGAVAPGMVPTDSVRLLDEEELYWSFSRDNVRLIQTPQLFERSILLESYQRYFLRPLSKCTDDASIVEEYGGLLPTIVEGEECNIKITTPKDLALANWYLSRFLMDE